MFFVSIPLGFPKEYNNSIMLENICQPNMIDFVFWQIGCPKVLRYKYTVLQIAPVLALLLFPSRQDNIIDITPPPVLPWLKRLDDRVASLMIVSGCMSIL